MKKKKEKINSKKAHLWLILWGVLTAAASGFMMFVACDGFFELHEGYAIPAIMACFSVLLFLISVMIDQKSPQVKSWPEALFVTLTAAAITEVVLLPFLWETIHPLEIILVLLTAAAAGFLFWKRMPINRNITSSRYLARLRIIR